MSKELETLEKLKEHLKYEWIDNLSNTEYYDILKQSLQRLECIDNSEPREALECLECLYSDPEDYRSNDRAKDYETIKNYILKTQEQKQYLKWDDLQFSYGTKIQKVRMGDTIYKIECVYYDNVKEVKLLSEDEKCYYLGFTGNYKDNVQLFNNLHLEVVEE